MKLPFYIARRYLFSRKSHNAINIISAVSVCGVTLATLALICTLSVFNGFHDLVESMFTHFDPELKIEAAKGKTFVPGDSLMEAIVHGLKDSAVSAVIDLLKNKAPMDIVNESVIPSLDRVGRDFEKGTVFLPQLLMSAEAAKSAFEVIKNTIAASGSKNEKVGKIILATVEGDIHDIGKNIVKVLLESYNFDVIDLGRDVPAQVVADKVRELNVPVVGLSALMTTTVPSMEATIKLLRKTSPECKVCVGGAVLTQEYADMIGADKYCPDAMSTVNFAQQIYNV